MGNRAVIKFKDCEVGIYLHWNGGRDSVEAFLDYCIMKEFRDGEYGVARMAQIIGNYFGGNLSIGACGTLCALSDLNPGDNGVYIIDDWKIVGRYPRNITEQNEYDRREMLLDIDAAQPVKEQLGKEVIDDYLAKHGYVFHE